MPEQRGINTNTQRVVDLNSKVVSLQTKAGADKFIADRKVAMTAKKGKLSKSMQWQTDKMIELMEKNPTLFIQREIEATQKALSVLEAK